MFVRGIAADEKNGAGGCDVAQAGGFARGARKGAREGWIVGGALVINVVGLEYSARELLQKIVFFVGGAG